ncbi:MAG: SAM-dependent methyltransferase, partial [Rhodobacteraceae bacterium]|nr:SAM-dependent methyltransferase [Paracoccaceae bacterium]
MVSRFLRQHQNSLLFSILDNLQSGEVLLTMPDGVQKRFAGPTAGPKADLTIHSQDAVYRILSDGKMGFCEAFMDGLVSSESLPQLIE